MILRGELFTATTEFVMMVRELSSLAQHNLSDS